jgi:hypothetical protein
MAPAPATNTMPVPAIAPTMAVSAWPATSEADSGGLSR